MIMYARISKYSKKKICSWLKKGQLEEDAFSKFIYYWISFNAFYEVGFPEDERSRNRRGVDTKHATTKFERLLMILKPKAGELLQDFDNDIKVLTDKNQVKSQSTQIGIDAFLKDYPRRELRSLQNLFRIIYSVRNRLFHGDKTYGKEVNKPVLNASNRILNKVIDESLESYPKFEET